jgi:hypothetical protein
MQDEGSWDEKEKLDQKLLKPLEAIKFPGSTYI